MDQHPDELAAIEALNNGKTFHCARTIDVPLAISTIRYYAGWADKIHGQVIETQEDQLVYTRHEPFGVVGQIIPSSFPRTLTTHLLFLYVTNPLLDSSSHGLEAWPRSCHGKLRRAEAI